ncbi:hypothetical protein GWK47_029940 [Chionoecetes opilio]|uniref:Uncharacterized protein n=1 Tax=Chionoecetes opilio TaxID=41210 RepID=A0A8J5D4Z3_CHIOP|nr:hypothetical protein GWK47_029940 [Chionoecetes opilio]
MVASLALKSGQELSDCRLQVNGAIFTWRRGKQNRQQPSPLTQRLPFHEQNGYVPANVLFVAGLVKVSTVRSVWSYESSGGTPAHAFPYEVPQLEQWMKFSGQTMVLVSVVSELVVDMICPLCMIPDQLIHVCGSHQMQEALAEREFLNCRRLTINLQILQESPLKPSVRNGLAADVD